jgi:hypothetical protein
VIVAARRVTATLVRGEAAVLAEPRSAAWRRAPNAFFSPVSLPNARPNSVTRVSNTPLSKASVFASRPSTSFPVRNEPLHRVHRRSPVRATHQPPQTSPPCPSEWKETDLLATAAHDNLRMLDEDTDTSRQRHAVLLSNSSPSHPYLHKTINSAPNSSLATIHYTARGGHIVPNCLTNTQQQLRLQALLLLTGSRTGRGKLRLQSTFALHSGGGCTCDGDANGLICLGVKAEFDKTLVELYVSLQRIVVRCWPDVVGDSAGDLPCPAGVSVLRRAAIIFTVRSRMRRIKSWVSSSLHSAL